MRKVTAAIAALALLPVFRAHGAYAAGVVRYPLPPGIKFPIARAVAVPAGYELIFHSGTGPSPANPKAPKFSPEYWGDMQAQTVSVLENMEKSLQEMGLTFRDVVKMNAYLVGDPKTGRMDFKGFMAGYTRFFGTRSEPDLPARSAVQVAGLAAPGALVEIEVILAKKVGAKGR